MLILTAMLGYLPAVVALAAPRRVPVPICARVQWRP